MRYTDFIVKKAYKKKHQASKLATYIVESGMASHQPCKTNVGAELALLVYNNKQIFINAIQTLYPIKRI